MPHATKNDIETLLVSKVLQSSPINVHGLSPRAVLCRGWGNAAALHRDSKGTERRCKALLNSGVSWDLESSQLFRKT